MQHLRVEHRNDASRSTGEGGFVLLATLFLILMLSAGAVFFVNAARDEQMMGRSMREFGRAFYSAEAGVSYMVGTWAALEYDTATPSPGDSIDLGWTDLDYGARFHALLRRTDGGTGRRMYSLRIIGEGTRRDGGRSVRTMDLMATPWDLDIAVAGQIKPHLTGGATCWTQPWKNWGDPEIQYSSCVVERAILGAGLYSVQPVGGRAWHQSQ